MAAQWQAWSACSGETGVCAPGTTQDEPCGRCGTRSSRCTTACSWSSGSCSGNGACDPGAVESSSIGCSVGNVKERTCGAACAYGAWGACTNHPPPECAPGQIDSEACGRCGTRARLCDASGFYQAWGACQNETGACTPGSSRQDSCGRCGTRTLGCNSACTWIPGACTGEGICAPGATPWRDVPTSPLSARLGAASVVRGDEVWILGGRTSTNAWTASAATFDAKSNGWRAWATPAAMKRRANSALVSTGDTLLVWGGDELTTTKHSDGWHYDIGAKTWSRMGAAGEPSARTDFVHFYDSVSDRFCVWGGEGQGYLNDGACYDVASKIWSPMATSPLAKRHRALFTWDQASRRLFVFGGYGIGLEPFRDGAAYSSASNSWTTFSSPPTAFRGRREGVAAFLGGRLLLAGGTGLMPYAKDDGARYDVANPTWTIDAPLPFATGELPGIAVRSNRAFVYGGRDDAGQFVEEGAIFDGATQTYARISGAPAVNRPGRRYQPIVEWTATQGVFVWGGYRSGDDYLGDGKRYDP